MNLTEPRKRSIFRRIEVDPETDCWLWTGSTFPSGYGQIMIGHKNFRVHRVLWEYVNGKVPTGYELHHACEVRRCVNPEHLALVTRKEHVRIHRPG